MLRRRLTYYPYGMQKEFQSFIKNVQIIYEKLTTKTKTILKKNTNLSQKLKYTAFYVYQLKRRYFNQSVKYRITETKYHMKRIDKIRLYLGNS